MLLTGISLATVHSRSCKSLYGQAESALACRCRSQRHSGEAYKLST